MKAVWITKAGGPEVLEVRETADPEPKAGEVRVRVKASGLNFAEVSARHGLYPDAPKKPCVVGYEVAGVVDKLGAGVTEPEVGARVFGMVRFGGHSDVVCLPASQAVPMPEGMSFEDGAALPVVYLTAYHMLFRIANLHPGESVLIQGAGGGVGLAVLQLCQTVDNVTVFGTASPHKHDLLREYGCTHPIDYTSKDYEAEVMRLTDGKGVHIVLDPRGGNDWKKGYRLLRNVGRLVVFGFANMISGKKVNYLRVVSQLLKVPRYNPLDLMDKNRMVAGVNMGHMWDEQEMMREHLDALVALYNAGKIKPRIDSVFPFDKAGEAHQRLENHKNVGKVILVPEL